MSDEKENIRKGLIKNKELSEDGSKEVATYDAQLLKLTKIRPKLSEGELSRNTVYDLESLIHKLEREGSTLLLLYRVSNRIFKAKLRARY